jgi:hypothetical protein
VRDSRRSSSFTQILERKRQRAGRAATIIGVDTPRLDANGRRSGENRLRDVAIRLIGASMSSDDACVRLVAAAKHVAWVSPPPFSMPLHRTATPNAFDERSMSS